MSNRHASRAILVLESPWALYDNDANRSSVIPFVQGVAKLTGDTDVHHPALFTRALIERSEGTGCWHCLSGFASSARVAVE